MASKVEIIKKCEELIRTFNSITHSIDTHIQDHLTNTKYNNNDQNFIQQVVYGWYRHKNALDGLISNFFIDNAAKVARADKILYTIFTYLAVYRLDDLGFQYFKQYAATQDPTKIFNLLSYIFNHENLWSILRAEWMKHYDLSYVEDDLIAGIESFIPDCQGYLFELQEKAQGLAAAQAAKEQALKNGTAGLGEVEKKKNTIPISPRITRPRPPRLPEPIEIPQTVVVNEVPSHLNDITLQTLEEKRQQRLEEIRQQTLAQYSEKHHFKLHSTNYGKSLDEIKQEIEEKQNSELKFNSSYVNIPPDFHSIPAQVRINAATILREDSLYRKQQAKDVQLLKQYEWELKDSSEYYTWQQEMKERDQHEKLLLVNLRRQQAKSSAIDAKEALNKQKEDNLLIGNILREQSNEIKLQKQLENEINLLINQENVIKISHERELKPKEAKKIILEKKIENTKKLKNELQEKLHEKELNDILEEEIRADKIRQLKALNSVHHEVIKVFDPTEIAGVGVMNEMSYMEMKERLEINKNYEKIQIENKKDEILEEKEKKAAKLHKKSLLILQARERRAQATALYHQKIQEKKLKLLEEENFIKIENSIKLHHELQEKREIKLNEKEKLQLEAERIKRKQQYLGQAMGRVDEIRNEEILKSEERKILKQQNELKEEIKLKELTQLKNLNNKEKLQKNEKKLKRNALQEAEITALRERKIAMEKLKEEYQQKKEKVHEGHQHHQKVKEIIKENNRYADRITQESLERARNSTNTSRAKTS